MMTLTQSDRRFRKAALKEGRQLLAEVLKVSEVLDGDISSPGSALKWLPMLGN